MPKSKEPQCKIEELVHRKIFDLIRYLDPDTDRESSRENDNSVLGVFVILITLFSSCSRLYNQGIQNLLRDMA